jgi:RNA polymerase sigma-70 factor, ECF subfamily
MGDEAELVRRAAAGDREAAGEIYDRYVPLVRAILLDATGSMAEANDLVQEVFIRALDGLKQLRDPDRLCAWMIGIARRQGIEYRRRSGRRRRWFVSLVTDVPCTNRPDSEDALDAVREAIRKLPERERLAIHIHYLSGQPAEVARRALGLSSSGFYKLLERARRGLRAQLTEAEATP